MHQRQTIRIAIAAALVGNTAAASQVSANRQNAFRQKELPAIDIVSVSDDVSDGSANTAPRELEHSYVLAVRGWVKVTAAVDDTMDDLAAQIETVMHADRFFGGACADSILTSTDFSFQPQGDLELGAVSLFYRVKYYTCAPVAPAGLDDFTTVHATHKQGADQHDDDDAEDSITVQTP